MSLKIWLPLNNNLNNQGLTNWTPTIQSGTTATYVNGKISKALNTGGIVMPASVTKEVLNNNEFSYACWLYVGGESGSTQSAMIFGNNSRRQFSMFQYPSANDFHYSWSNYENGTWSSYWGGVLSGVLPSNQWTHIAVVYNNNITDKLKIYINGVSQTLGSRSFVSKSTSFEFDTQLIHNSTYHYLNDVRLYDHALSAKEVSELAKGLVLHYRLSGVGGENIMPNSRTMALGSANASTGTWRLAGYSTMTKSRVAIDSSPIGSCYGFQNEGIQTPDDGSCYGIDNFPFEANTDYTISMWARIVNGSEGYAGFAIAGATFGNGSYTKFEKNYYVTPLISDGKWVKCWLNFTTNSNTNRNIYIGIVTGDTNVTTQMCGVKIEKGLKSTPWCPNPSDTEYHTMGLDDDIEYDCSGFGNNGTKTGIIDSDTDTARYTTSYYFNGSSYISSANASFSWFNFDCGTLSAWIKPTVSISGWSGSIGIQADDSQYFKSFCLTDFDNQFRVTTTNGSWTTLSSGKTIPLNEWTHIAATLDGTILKMYFNGELVSTQTVTWNSATVSGITKFAVAIDLPGGDEKFTGNVSDVRFYSTVLSPSDILALYNLGGSIDNNGVFHTYEYVEV